jgi:maltokinase
MKDVAGMLRSFQYATLFVLAERAESSSSSLEPLARAWEERNRDAFLRGYYGHDGIDTLLPLDLEDRGAVRVAFELDKALYELGYEKAFRPSWKAIPSAALYRLLSTPVATLVAAPYSQPPGEGPATAGPLARG